VVFFSILYIIIIFFFCRLKMSTSQKSKMSKNESLDLRYKHPKCYCNTFAHIRVVGPTKETVGKLFCNCPYNKCRFFAWLKLASVNWVKSNEIHEDEVCYEDDDDEVQSTGAKLTNENVEVATMLKEMQSKMEKIKKKFSNGLLILTDGSETVDPGVNFQTLTHDEEFPLLDRNALPATKKSSTGKRSGDSLEHQPSSNLQAQPTTTQAPVIQKWSFRDMVNKHRNHEDLNSDDDGVEDGIEEDVVVDLSCPVPKIKIAQRFIEQINKKWQNAVVLKPFDESLSMASLYNRLTKMWPFMAGCNMMDLESGFYLVHFQNNDDTVRVLTGGPYVVGNSYMHVQPWTLDFDATKEELSTTVAWIRLPGMPAHLYHKKIFRNIGRIFGKVVKIDQQTAALTRGKYARLAVTVDLTKPLCVSFAINGKTQRVVYENLPVICFQCGRIGHT
ncbi:Unknown protein, partial [Striga hermonthica]